LAITFHDPDHSISEQRFKTVGMPGADRLLIVAHADGEDCIRIISARRTTRGEQEYYEEKQ
jgi:uncharacterized DUF497 family protein